MKIGWKGWKLDEKGWKLDEKGWKLDEKWMKKNENWMKKDKNWMRKNENWMKKGEILLFWKGMEIDISSIVVMFTPIYWLSTQGYSPDDIAWTRWERSSCIWHN